MDYEESMKEMEILAEGTGRQVTFPNKHLLKLDQGNIHKVAERENSGIRTFVKISVSDKLYSQKGNSINHNLDYPRPSIERGRSRNCPAKGA